MSISATSSPDACPICLEAEPSKQLHEKESVEMKTHAVCQSCLIEMAKHSLWPSCPICRRTVLIDPNRGSPALGSPQLLKIRGILL